jgi:tetratricopeptide (TPR) repeat protein
MPVDLSPLAVAEDTPAWPGIVVAVALGLAARLVPAARRGILALGALAYLLFMAPTLAVRGSLVLENRLYLPSVGVLVLLGELAFAARAERRTVLALSTAIVVGFAAIGFGYEGSFHDPRAFGEAAAAGSPHSALAHFCLGQAYQRASKNDRALAEYRTSLLLEPLDEVHNNIAVIHMAAARWPEAESELLAELAMNPGSRRAHHNLSIVLRREGRIEEALRADQAASSATSE